MSDSTALRLQRILDTAAEAERPNFLQIFLALWEFDNMPSSDPFDVAIRELRHMMEAKYNLPTLDHLVECRGFLTQCDCAKRAQSSTPEPTK